jgi:O-antigen/teichoic acid export membrane protein
VKTPAKSAALSVATSIASRAGVVILNTATGILTARALHPAGRGELTAMNLWPLFLANATALGTPSSLIYHLRKHAARRGELIASALTMVTALGCLAALAGAVALPHWLGKYPPEVVHFAQLFLIVAPFWSIQITGQAALEALELFSLSNIVQVTIPVTTLAGLLTFLALGRLTPVTAGACYTFTIVPTAMAIVVMLWHRRGAQIPSVSVAAWRTLVDYGVRSAPLDLMNTFNQYLDTVLVIGLLSASSMGTYQVVLSLSRALLVIQQAVVMVLFPKAAGKSIDTILDMVGRSVRVGTIVTGTAALSAALIGPLLLGLLYGHDYLAAVPALRVLVTEVVVQGAVVVMAQAFMAAGRPGIVSLLQAIGLSVSVPLMFVFIPRYGTAGAALALLCSTVTRFILIFFAIRIVLKKPLPRVLPGIADLRTLHRLILRRSG